MEPGPSILSLIAAAIYAIVVLACLVACHAARTHRQRAWHTYVWALLALLFIALIVSRVLNLEDTMREGLRLWLQSEELSAGRRAYQGPVIAILLIIAATIFGGAVYWVSSQISGKRNIAVAAAAAAGGVLLALVGLRLVSLHAMDALLFGPLKLNWVGDLGATAVVCVCAVFYVRRVRNPQLRPSRSRPR